MRMEQLSPSARRLASVGAAVAPAATSGDNPAEDQPRRRPLRVLAAGLFHETHSFVDERTPLASFTAEYGDALLAHRHDDSPLAGLLQVAAERGWDLRPVIDLRATPSGLCDDAVLEHWWAHVSRALDDAAAPPDAIFLVRCTALWLFSYHTLSLIVVWRVVSNLVE